ncbi:hypothetical protein ACJMK2_026781, partial [Sinanodonta woodiana]
TENLNVDFNVITRNTGTARASLARSEEESYNTAFLIGGKEVSVINVTILYQT